MYEIFNPRDGRALLTVRWRWTASIISWLVPSVDYARKGEGWLNK